MNSGMDSGMDLAWIFAPAGMDLVWGWYGFGIPTTVFSHMNSGMDLAMDLAWICNGFFFPGRMDLSMDFV